MKPARRSRWSAVALFHGFLQLLLLVTFVTTDTLFAATTMPEAVEINVSTSLSSSESLAITRLRKKCARRSDYECARYILDPASWEQASEDLALQLKVETKAFRMRSKMLQWMVADFAAEDEEVRPAGEYATEICPWHEIGADSELSGSDLQYSEGECISEVSAMLVGLASVLDPLNAAFVSPSASGLPIKLRLDLFPEREILFTIPMGSGNYGGEKMMELLYRLCIRYEISFASCGELVERVMQHPTDILSVSQNLHHDSSSLVSPLDKLFEDRLQSTEEFLSTVDAAAIESCARLAAIEGNAFFFSNDLCLKPVNKVFTTILLEHLQKGDIGHELQQRTNGAEGVGLVDWVCSQVQATTDLTSPLSPSQQKACAEVLRTNLQHLLAIFSQAPEIQPQEESAEFAWIISPSAAMVLVAIAWIFLALRSRVSRALRQPHVMPLMAESVSEDDADRLELPAKSKLDDRELKRPMMAEPLLTAAAAAATTSSHLREAELTTKVMEHPEIIGEEYPVEDLLQDLDPAASDRDAERVVIEDLVSSPELDETVMTELVSTGTLESDELLLFQDIADDQNQDEENALENENQVDLHDEESISIATETEIVQAKTGKDLEPHEDPAETSPSKSVEASGKHDDPLADWRQNLLLAEKQKLVQHLSTTAQGATVTVARMEEAEMSSDSDALTPNGKNNRGARNLLYSGASSSLGSSAAKLQQKAVVQALFDQQSSILRALSENSNHTIAPKEFQSPEADFDNAKESIVEEDPLAEDEEQGNQESSVDDHENLVWLKTGECAAHNVTDAVETHAAVVVCQDNQAEDAENATLPQARQLDRVEAVTKLSPVTTGIALDGLNLPRPWAGHGLPAVKRSLVFELSGGVSGLAKDSSVATKRVEPLHLRLLSRSLLSISCSLAFGDMQAHLSLARAATKIQCRYRIHRAKKVAQKLRYELLARKRFCAAVTIQCAWKSFKLRRAEAMTFHSHTDPVAVQSIPELLAEMNPQIPYEYVQQLYNSMQWKANYILEHQNSRKLHRQLMRLCRKIHRAFLRGTLRINNVPVMAPKSSSSPASSPAVVSSSTKAASVPSTGMRISGKKKSSRSRRCAKKSYKMVSCPLPTIEEDEELTY